MMGGKGSREAGSVNSDESVSLKGDIIKPRKKERKKRKENRERRKKKIP